MLTSSLSDQIRSPKFWSLTSDFWAAFSLSRTKLDEAFDCLFEQGHKFHRFSQPFNESLNTRIETLWKTQWNRIFSPNSDFHSDLHSKLSHVCSHNLQIRQLLTLLTLTLWVNVFKYVFSVLLWLCCFSPSVRIWDIFVLSSKISWFPAIPHKRPHTETFPKETTAMSDLPSDPQTSRFHIIPRSLIAIHHNSHHTHKH
jgi:hypothetical protein